MVWRPWVTAASLIVAFVTSVVMFATEEMMPPDKTSNAKVKIEDRLVSDMYWVAGDRRKNFERMGLPSDLVDRAMDQAKRWKKERGEAFKAVLSNQQDLLGASFCKNAEPPVRYAAMAFLVIPDGNARRALGPMEISELEGQDWYATGRVLDVYQTLELAIDDDYHPDATFMGISAILLAEEEKVIKMEYPWGKGTLTSGWSIGGLIDDYRGVHIDDRAVDYFALMHIFAEIANEETGICNT